MISRRRFLGLGAGAAVLGSTAGLLSSKGHASAVAPAPFDSYAGTDDQKLDAALAASLHVQLPERSLSFSKRGRPIPKGLRIEGAGRQGPIALNFDSRVDGVGWFHATGGTAKRATFSDLQLFGSLGAAFLTQDAVSGFQQLQLRSIRTSGLYGAIGTAKQRLALTACWFGGPDWDINNGTDTAIYIAGSDNVFWPDGLLLDSPASLAPASDTPHLRVAYMDKSTFGRVYCTAEGNWSGLRYEGQSYDSGSSGGNSGPCTFDSAVFEGRNKDAPCNGPVVRVLGGMPVLRDCWFGYSRATTGVVSVAGGYVRAECPTYGQATGVPESAPLFAVGGGARLYARGGAVGSQAGRWTDPRPRIVTAAGATDADGTFVVA